MQYHLNGFKPGDPREATVSDNHTGEGDQVDVLIVGCGPAGLSLAAQLAVFPDISTRIIEKKEGPLKFGQADGIACRSMEMFEAFGFSEKVSREAYWVNETAFWRPEGTGGKICRAERIQDVEDDLSEFPHTILSQARVHDFFLEAMKLSASRLSPSYNCELIQLEREPGSGFPLKASVKHITRDGYERVEEIYAKYVVGCDGARSMVRQSMGLELSGEASQQLWGVMDVLAVTDFPDIRLKCAIQSETAGSMLIIPREGGYMVRLYIELEPLKAGERAKDRNITSDNLISRAKAILSPYTLEVKEVAWWSAYEIGQRVCKAFDDGEHEPRIFIAGDACHTHSPKAGQGMNVSMADSFNLGWKLAAVISNQCIPKLLATYSSERHAKAVELIEFDRDMARLFSKKPASDKEATVFQEYFQRHGRYTAGVETRYEPSMIVGRGEKQHLAVGEFTGKRLHSAPVVRFADAKSVELGHLVKADGRWRVFAFGPLGDKGQTGSVVSQLCEFLQSSPSSPITKYSPSNSDIDSLIDVRAVFQCSHLDLDITAMPELLLPKKGKHQLIDYEKVYCSELKDGPDIYERRGIDRTAGAVLIIRPDQFVAEVVSLRDYQAITTFFDGFMLEHARN